MATMTINSDLIVSGSNANLSQVTDRAINHNLIKVLYNNTDGTSGTVSLNDEVSKYDYIEIFFKCVSPHNVYSSVKVSNPLNKNVCLICGHETTNDNHTYYQWHKTVTINETEIVNQKYSRWFNIWGTNGVQYGVENGISITQVIGYIV